MIDFVALLIAVPAFVYSFFFGDINSEAELWKNIILAIIAIVSGGAIAVRQLIKCLKEIREYLDKYGKKKVKRERV